MLLASPGRRWSSTPVRYFGIVVGAGDLVRPMSEYANVHVLGGVATCRDDGNDDSFLLLVDAHHQQIAFTLPGEEHGRSWEIVIDRPIRSLATARRRPPPGTDWT